MKTEMASFELKYMVKELQQLVDARLQQIYQPKGLLLQFHKSNVGKFYLRIETNALWLTEDKDDMPEKIAGLCQAMRKYTKGKRITKLAQIESERIIEIELKTQKETYYVIIELFQNGNIILLDKNKKIIKAFEQREWKDRTIKAGVQYKLPPTKRNISKLEESDFKDKDEKSIAKLGFGGLYAKEIMARGGNYSAYKSLMKSPLNSHFYDNGEITPIKLKQKDDGEKYPSFSKAIENNWKDELPKKTAKKSSKLEKVERQIEMQQKVVENLEKKAIEEHRKGEIIYEHFQEVEAALKKAKGPKKFKIEF
jgi:predicted ribosome quality control (RQC) complex YloA/Tae2 family protein